MHDLLVRWLGRVPYAEAVRLQDVLVEARRRGEAPDTLVLLEHPPVITLGRAADPAQVLLSRRELASRGIGLHEAGRGGGATYHGPGQLVGYPVVALPEARRDAHGYLRDLEEALIRTVAGFGIRAGRLPGKTGVWAGDRKLASLGVRLSIGWIASHGFALNVDADLNGFGAIVPCGLAGVRMTSMSEILGRAVRVEEVAAGAAERTAEVLGLRPVPSGSHREHLPAPARQVAAVP